MNCCRCINSFSVGKETLNPFGRAVPSNRTNCVFLILHKGEADGRSCTSVGLWDVNTGVCLRTFVETGDWVVDLIVLDDGESFLYASGNTILQCNISNGEHVGSFETGTRVYQMAKLDDTRIVTAQYEGFPVCVWNFITGERLSSITRGCEISPVVILGNERIFMIHEGNCALVWNVADGVEKEWSTSDDIISVDAIDSETVICQMEREDHRYAVSVLKADTGEEIQHFASKKYWWGDIVPVGGRRFLAMLDMFNVGMFSIETRECNFVFEGRRGVRIRSIAPVDGTRFITISKDGSISLWDYSHWFAIKHLILLRELFNRGRALLTRRSNRKRLRSGRAHHVGTNLGLDPILQQIICVRSDDIFRKVMSFVD